MSQAAKTTLIGDFDAFDLICVVNDKFLAIVTVNANGVIATRSAGERPIAVLVEKRYTAELDLSLEDHARRSRFVARVVLRRGEVDSWAGHPVRTGTETLGRKDLPRRGFVGLMVEYLG